MAIRDDHTINPSPKNLWARAKSTDYNTLTAVSAGKVLALPKKDSLGNKVVLALPYTNTSVALLQHYYTPTLL